jgi:hypothetical protein
MPKTAVGLFENPIIVDNVIRQIEALGFPWNEIRALDEPESFEVTGVMSFARFEFEGDLIRELTKIGTMAVSHRRAMWHRLKLSWKQHACSWPTWEFSEPNSNMRSQY